MPENIVKVSYMDNIFYNCSKLTSIDLSNFNTENVISMNNIFGGCSSLTSIDISSFKKGSFDTLHYIFDDSFPNYGNIKINRTFYNSLRKSDLYNWNITFV